MIQRRPEWTRPSHPPRPRRSRVPTPGPAPAPRADRAPRTRSAPTIGVWRRPGTGLLFSSPSSTVPVNPRPCGPAPTKTSGRTAYAAKSGGHVAISVGQRNPQLHTVQPRRSVGPRQLAVHDAAPAVIRLSSPGRTSTAARGCPGARLRPPSASSPSAGRCADAPTPASRAGRQDLGAVMIEKAPGADHPNLPVRQRSRHLGGLAKRDPAGGDQQLFGPGGRK